MIRPALIHNTRHYLHDPNDHPDGLRRGEALLGAALAAGLGPALPPQDFGQEPLTTVHSPALIALLQTAYERFAELKGPRPAVPDGFAVRHLAGYIPQSIWGRLGHYCSDNLTPILPGTWEAAYWSAQTALTGAEMLAEGASLVYALCRPPGHHAYADLYGGYCYLNNAAVAAERLARRGRRVAVLDLDYHHGNGTQAIFYDRADVFFCSIHADPEHEYPYYCGYAHERGAAAGEGYTLNLPLPIGADETVYLAALDAALEIIGGFRPEALLVSLGFDALAGDPVAEGGFALTPNSYERIGRRVAGLRRPTLIVQEGGYWVERLGDCLAAFFAGLRE